MFSIAKLVPSKYARKCFKEKGFTFTDFNKATIIWNEYGDKDVLRELADTTSDDILKQQICERLAYEEKKSKVFQDNSSGRYVYVVLDEEGYPCGYFADYRMAHDYGIRHAKNNTEKVVEVNGMTRNYGFYSVKKKKDTKFEIEKQLIVASKKDLTVKWLSRRNPNLFPEKETYKYSDYHGSAVATMSCCSADGTIRNVWSNEMPREDEVRVDEYRPERFENQFIKMPFECYPGMAVRCLDAGHKGRYGIVRVDWNEELRFIEEKNLFCDFSDVEVKVVFLTEDGIWDHDHIAPMYLEKADYRCEGDDEKARAEMRAAESLTNYLIKQSENAPDLDVYAEKAIKCAQRYRDIYLKLMVDRMKKRKMVDFTKVATVEDLFM